LGNAVVFIHGQAKSVALFSEVRVQKALGVGIAKKSSSYVETFCVSCDYEGGSAYLEI
jgi:hypothetical protein